MGFYHPQNDFFFDEIALLTQMLSMLRVSAKVLLHVVIRFYDMTLSMLYDKHFSYIQVKCFPGVTSAMPVMDVGMELHITSSNRCYNVEIEWSDYQAPLLHSQLWMWEWNCLLPVLTGAIMWK